MGLLAPFLLTPTPQLPAIARRSSPGPFRHLLVVLQTHPLQTQRIKDIRHVNGGKKMYQRGGVKMYQSPGLSLSP